MDNCISTGGNVFNAAATIMHTGSLRTDFRMATVNGDVFNGEVSFTNSSNGIFTVSQADTSWFNGNITLNNNGTHMIYFGYSGGVSELAAGKTISVGSTGYALNELILYKFRQNGATAQNLTLTGTAVLTMKGCQFNGAATISAPEILCSYSVFNGTTQITKTGTSINYWYGSNTFNGITTITNQGTTDNDDDLRLADELPNIYNHEVNFQSTGKPIQVVWNGGSDFYGDVFVSHEAIDFGSGEAFFRGSEMQTLSGDTTIHFSYVTIDKTAGGVTLQTPATVSRTLTFTEGYFYTDTTHILTFLAGSDATGAHDGSFVSGPVQKVGDTAFEFPVGKGEYYSPIEIAAPDSVTDSFIAEYFDYTQEIGSYIDTIIISLSEANYWMLERKIGVSDVEVAFKWRKFLYGNGIDSTRIKIAFWNDSIWNVIPTDTVIQDAFDITLRSSNLISKFGYFTIANGSAGGNNSGIVTHDHKIQIWGSAVNHEHGFCNILTSAPTLVLHNASSLTGFNYCLGTTYHLENVKKLSMGFNQSLALLCDNTVCGWGVNHTHQLGNPEYSINNLVPKTSWAAVPVINGTTTTSPLLTDIIDIASGPFGSIGLRSDGKVYYWGAFISDIASSNIQVPSGSGTSEPEIVKYTAAGPDVENVIAIAAGGYHFLALLRNGTVLSWGRNLFGQLGNGTFSTLGERYPVLVLENSTQLLTGIKAIAGGELHSMALDLNGRVYCWGSNQYGQLGDISITTPEYANYISTINNIDGISAGTGHSIAFSGNLAWGFGNNLYNQLGLSSGGTNQNSPVAVLLPLGIAAINEAHCGEKHTIFLTKDKKIYGMGSSDITQLAIYVSNIPGGNSPAGTTPPIEISNQFNSALPIEAPLINCDQLINYCYYNLQIEANTAWPNSFPDCYLTSSLLIENELLIKNGTQLTLNSGCTLFFGPNGRIVLEEGNGTDAGAQLILNNGAVLTAAGDCMWKGIEVRGSAAHNATNSRQAKVIIHPGAIIEHAHNAVTLGKWDENYYACYESYPLSFSSGFDLSGSGGQLECDQATFQKNAIDIRIAPYQRISASFIMYSHFLGGQLRDNRYLSGTFSNPFYAPPNPLQRAHNAVNQWQTKVVTVEGNDFDNYETTLQYTDSRLRVIGNTFTNSRTGINSITTGAVLVYGGQVEGNSFTDVRTQIRAAGGKYLQIANENHFNNIFPFGSQQDNQFGIFMNQERAFRIFDNHFTRLRHGIVSTNSGFSGGQINYLGQGNIFTECWRSIHLQQNHRNLRIKCNKYLNPTSNLYNNNWYLISGVTLSNQGWANLTSDKTQAGNWFAQSPDFNELTSFSQIPFTYFRHASPDEVIPSAAGTGIINIDANSAAMSDFDDACEPVVVPPGGEPDRLAYFAGVLDSLSLEMDTLINSLDNNLTDSLLNIIHPMYVQDTIMNRLTGNLPLSNAVLIKAIDSPEALNDSALYEILFMNSPYSTEVLDALNERDPEFSEELRYELNQVQGLNPPYLTVTGLQKEMHYYQTDKQLLINDYVSRLVADDSTQKAISVLEAENSYEHLQTVFGTYLDMSEPDSAAAKFETLINHPDAEEDWLELHEIHLDLVTETKTWFDMDTIQEATIRSIATQETNTLAKVQARNVLHLVYRDTFPDYIDEEEYYLRQQQPVINLTTHKSKPGSKQLTVIPNPANDFITVELKGGKQKSCYLEIIDMTGKRQYYSKVGFKQNTYEMNVSFLNSRLYLVRITDNIGFNESSKLMIAR